jgi:hypothetical protein
MRDTRRAETVRILSVIAGNVDAIASRRLVKV